MTVCHSSKEKAFRVASENGFGSGYADFDEILKDDEIDIVEIVTPNYIHKEQIVYVLRHLLGCEFLSQ